MTDLTARIKRRLNMTAENYKSDCNFSRRLARLRVADELGGRLHLTHLSESAHNKKDDFIINYLSELLSPVIEKYKNDDNEGVYEENAPIWVFWWTGEDSAPELVRQCIQSIRKNSGSHPVHFIDKNNLGEYLTIPGYIMEKVNNRTIGLAFFSDYLRASLLSKYGGLWLDSTIFCSYAIPEKIFGSSFFTCKSELTECRYLSKYQWTSFCLGGYKGNIIFRFIKSAIELYLSRENALIDYLLIDYLFYIGKNNIPAIKKCMDSVPINNIHRDDLQAAMNAALDSDEFYSVIKNDTCFYKLSWRETYSLKSENGQDSVYKYFLDMRI